MPIDGFQHVNIRTTDADRARDFYVRALGLRVGDRPPFASVGYWQAQGRGAESGANPTSRSS